MSKLLKCALWYRRRGFSVIPLRESRKPIEAWKRWQSEKPTTNQINDWWERYPSANVGIVTGKISNLIVIDIDSEEALKEVEKLTPDQLIFPIASTPRGEWGQHRYFLYQEGARNSSSAVIKNIDIRAEGGFIAAPPTTTTKGEYKWLDGCGIHEVPLCEVPPGYNDLVMAKRKNKHGIITSAPAVNLSKGYRDQTIFHLAHHLVKSGMPKENISDYLRVVAGCCEPPFPLEDVQGKINSALDRADRGDKSLSVEVRDFATSSTGVFLLSELYHSLYVKSRDDKKNISKILSRLREEGIIEKYGDKNGCFRKVENQCTTIDWLSVKQEELDIKYPLGIEGYFNTMPKNIICIAGSPDAGKTALLLNFVKLNMDKHKIHYFSSEMGDMELKGRLANFNIPLPGWKFHAKERAGSFADVIEPNDINIIDFLEVSDAFYNIGGMITDIFNKLDKGIALIALQKNKGAEVGRGGTFSLEKPRLYLSVDPDFPGAKAKIIKCKNWKHPQINPNGMECKFKLVGGANITMTEQWSRK